MITPCTIFDHSKNGFLEYANDHQHLLCDEVWDMSPLPTSSSTATDQNNNHIGNSVLMIPKDEFNQSFDAYLRKEIKFMTGFGYIHLLESNPFVAHCRLKAILWFVHSQKQFNFGMGTVFNAVNYLDRFMDINRCHGWNHWMMELLSLASLSIALKFSETCPPSLHEIQESLDYGFEARLIQRMELKILKSLKWELNSITAYSYVELITGELNSILTPFILDDLTSTMNGILLASSLDVKMVVYRPCVIVSSALQHVVNNQEGLSHFAGFVPPDQKQNLQSCYKKMQDILVKFQEIEAYRNPSSPDTVLTKEEVAIYENQVDLSFIDGPATKNDLKRKRKLGDDGGVKHKKCVNK